MQSPGLIGRKAPPGQGAIATRRLNTQIKLLLCSCGMVGSAILFGVAAFIYLRKGGEPHGDFFPVVWSAICLILSCFSIPYLRRKLANLKLEELRELAEREGDVHSQNATCRISARRA